MLGALGEPGKEAAKEADKAAREQAKIDAEIERQQAKYSKLHEMAISYEASETERVTWKLAFDLGNMEKEREAARAHKAWNEELETSYQQARIERTAMAEAEVTKIKEKQNEQRMRGELTVATFKRQLDDKHYSDALGTASRLTAGLAQHNRAAFEINKIAGTGKAIVDTYAAVAGVLKEYPGPVGWGMAAVQVGLGMAQVSAIQSTSFGGGSLSQGGGIPSMSTTPGIPVAVEPSSAPSSAPTVANAPREVNFHLPGGVQLVDMDKFMRDQIIPALNEAIGDGVTVNVRTA